MTKKIISHSEQETIKIGKTLSKVLAPGDIVGLIGELGSGKTTLIKGMLSGLNYNEKSVYSASFVIVQEYKAKIPVYHIDLYRLKDLYELYDLDWDCYISSETIALIEWAEKIENSLPLNIRIRISIVSKNKRGIVLETEQPKYQKLISKL